MNPGHACASDFPDEWEFAVPGRENSRIISRYNPFAFQSINRSLFELLFKRAKWFPKASCAHAGLRGNWGMNGLHL